MLMISVASSASESSRASTTSGATSAPAVTAPVLGTSEYRIRLEEQESRFNLGLYVQASQFTFQGRSLLGNALEVNASYAIRSNIAASVSVAQAVTLQGGLGVLYTGIRAAGQYAFWGDFIRRSSTVMVNGQRSLQTGSGRNSLLAADLGLEQFMFNGSSRVLPATGGSLGVRYDRSLAGFRASVIGRYGMLLVGTETSSMLTIGGGLLYSF